MQTDDKRSSNETHDDPTTEWAFLFFFGMLMVAILAGLWVLAQIGF